MIIIFLCVCMCVCVCVRVCVTEKVIILYHNSVPSLSSSFAVHIYIRQSVDYPVSSPNLHFALHYSTLTPRLPSTLCNILFPHAKQRIAHQGEINSSKFTQIHISQHLFHKQDPRFPTYSGFTLETWSSRSLSNCHT